MQLPLLLYCLKITQCFQSNIQYIQAKWKTISHYFQPQKNKNKNEKKIPEQWSHVYHSTYCFTIPIKTINHFKTTHPSLNNIKTGSTSQMKMRVLPMLKLNLKAPTHYSFCSTSFTIPHGYPCFSLDWSSSYPLHIPIYKLKASGPWKGEHALNPRILKENYTNITKK